MAQVRIYVQLNSYQSNDDIDVAYPINDFEIMANNQKLDYPKKGAAPMDAMFCTDLKTRLRVEAYRKEFVEGIAHNLESAIMDALSQKDTEMGYSKQELASETERG